MQEAAMIAHADLGGVVSGWCADTGKLNETLAGCKIPLDDRTVFPARVYSRARVPRGQACQRLLVRTEEALRDGSLNLWELTGR
jgi:hypothetical protein